jgi:hypothetical protein
MKSSIYVAVRLINEIVNKLEKLYVLVILKVIRTMQKQSASYDQGSI